MTAPKSIQVPTKIITSHGRRVNVPAHFFCAFSHNLMVHPLMNRDGINFERSAIIEWIQANGTCPLSGKPLKPSQLISNKGLEQKINIWREQNGFDKTSHESSDFKARGMAMMSVSKSKADELLSRSSAHSVASTTSSGSSSSRKNADDQAVRNERKRSTYIKRILAGKSA